MSNPGSISVAWPPTGLGEPGWRTRLECLATRSEALIGKHCRLADTAGLALELVGLLWPVLGAPETVAATCRASLLVGAPGVVAASSAADQLAEVHSRLDEIWQAAQEDPAAGAVELHPPLLIEVKPVPYELAGKVKPEPEALVDEVTDAAAEWANVEHVPHLDPEPNVQHVEHLDSCTDPNELPEAWQAEPEPIEREVVWLKSDELGAAIGVSQSEITHWQRRGLFDSEGLTRRPHPGEGRGRRFDLVACREIYLARPRRRQPPAPLPVVIEPTAPAPTPEAAADAAALLELAGGDAGTLAALRELLA